MQIISTSYPLYQARFPLISFENHNGNLCSSASGYKSTDPELLLSLTGFYNITSTEVVGASIVYITLFSVPYIMHHGKEKECNKGLAKVNGASLLYVW